MHLRVIEIQIGLMRVEAVPVISLRHRIPRPVGGLEILENDARFLVLLRRIAPDIQIAFRRARRGAARFLKPRVVIGSVIDDELYDHFESAFVRGRKKGLEIREGSEVRIDIVVIRDVIAIIVHGRGIKRQQPDGGHAQLLEIVELLDQTAKIADPIAVAVVKGLHMQFVDDCVLVPKRIGERITQGLCHAANSWRNNSHGAIVRFPLLPPPACYVEARGRPVECGAIPPLLPLGRSREQKTRSRFPQKRRSTTALQDASDKYCVPNNGHIVECGGAPPLLGSGAIAEGQVDVLGDSPDVKTPTKAQTGSFFLRNRHRGGCDTLPFAVPLHPCVRKTIGLRKSLA